MTPSLERRYATLTDITVADLLFADRDTRKALDGDVFDDLVPTKPSKKLAKVEEVSIADFIANILPKATSIEAMVENEHLNRLVSLIAPCDATAPLLFQWKNNFSWSYRGSFADSIKEKVKKAGGRVDGDLRCSLLWYNYDDLDLHMLEPGRFEIYYGQKHSPRTGGALDVDMNAGGGNTRSAVENIVYLRKANMRPGTYSLFVHNFNQRESEDVGFEVEIEFDGVIHTFAHPKALPNREQVLVAEIILSANGEFSIGKSLPSSQTPKEEWGIRTQSFVPVKAIMLSPNFWAESRGEGDGVGNKHYFFMLEGCKNDGTARGFYNEFLGSALRPHRKVLEIVGAKMQTKASDKQLSGLGFSSTGGGHLLCKVSGSFTRTVKVVF